MKKISLPKEKQDKLITQVRNEYTYAKEFLDPRFAEWLKRLKLYNNQKRDKDAVGDPLLFSIMHTLVAGFYADQLYVKFQPRESGDSAHADNVSSLASYDYEAMGKKEIDADWLWDAFFFGYGIVDNSYYDVDKKLPCPRVVDPMCFLYDPRAKSIASMRFLGEEYYVTKRELIDQGYKKDVIRKLKGVSGGTTDLPQQASQARAEAMGTEVVGWREGDFGDNSLIKQLVWKTWFEGKRVKVVLGNDAQELCEYTELDQDSWGYIDKRPFPQSHQFQGVSVPDLVEDKQRARSIILNLVLKIVQSDLFPKFLYNSSVIKNKADLAKFGFNQYVGIPSNNPGQEVAAMHKAQPNVYLIKDLLMSLDTAAQKAAATPDMQQGILNAQERSVGEINIAKQSADTRYALVAKALMRGEEAFWRQWYSLYKQFFKKGIAEKVLRIAGTGVDKFRPITRDNIIAKADYDVEIISSVLQEQDNAKKLGQYMQVANILPANPNTDMAEVTKIMVGYAGVDPAEQNRIFPLTFEEELAKRENEMLNLNRVPQVKETDDHKAHRRIHEAANQTDATFAHIESHKQLEMLQLEQQKEMAAAQTAQMGMEGVPEADAVQAADQEVGGMGSNVAGDEGRTPLVDSDTMKEIAPNSQLSPTQQAKLRNRLT